jgi:hypothetical protein
MKKRLIITDWIYLSKTEQGAALVPEIGHEDSQTFTDDRQRMNTV